MSLADALEEERREAADGESPLPGKSGLMDRDSAARHMLEIPPNTSARSSSRESKSSLFTAGNRDTTQSGLGKETRKQSASAEAMAAIFGGAPKDFQVSSRRRGTGRHNSTAEIGGMSRSPSSRLHRSSSPGLSLISNNRSSPMHIMTDPSDFNDSDSPDERPSSPKLEPKRIRSNSEPGDAPSHIRRGSSDSSNDIRLEKDQPPGGGTDEGAIESSEDDEDAKSSDEEEESTSERKRGRGRSRAKKGPDTSYDELEGSEDDPYASLYGQNKSTRQAKSALAAAEEESRCSCILCVVSVANSAS